MSDAPVQGVTITINAEGLDDAAIAQIERGVAETLGHESAEAAEISVTLLSDDDIRAMNAEYLGRDRPTDVLAFSLGAPGGVLGDVYVGSDQARRQAAEAGEALTTELVRLAIHGTLHVLGHDHPDGPERLESEMFTLQEHLVDRVIGSN